jgi:hypothetical protein
MHDDRTVNRFWAKISVRGPDECWPWKGHLNKDGYGTFRTNKPRRKVYAHRVAYEIEHGESPAGMLVRHSCDNPPCCNARHLLAGTHQDNSDDKISRGRDRHAEQAGELNRNAVLTEDSVRLIRQMIAQGRTNVSLAKEFGVTHQMVSLIRRGKNWTHVT